jgi:predicted nucleic acid-binding Zn ribbon protein
VPATYRTGSKVSFSEGVQRDPVRSIAARLRRSGRTFLLLMMLMLMLMLMLLIMMLMMLMMLDAAVVSKAGGTRRTQVPRRTSRQERPLASMVTGTAPLVPSAGEADITASPDPAGAE